MITPTVVIVIATYNEAATITALLDGLRAYRVIVVDDNSPDYTGARASAAGATVISRPTKQGLASAYMMGFGAALKLRPDYIVQMDAGGTHDPADVARLVRRAQATGAGLVIGSRFQTRQWQRGRTALSLAAAWLMRRLGISVRDATSGFRCWRADVVDRIDWVALTARGHAFQLETLYQTVAMGETIAELPIAYRLTNSTLTWGSIGEALRVYARLVRQEGRRRYALHTRLPRFQ